MYSDNNDFNSILSRLLSNVDDALDKREGSIIYDALAPAAAELAQCYIALDIYSEQTYLLTAVGENLDNKAVEAGITRQPATPTKVVIKTYDGSNVLMDVPIGSRFSAPNESGGYTYKVVTKQSTGVFIGECETSGSASNTYTGMLLPLQSINNLGNAEITSIDTFGEDVETDTDLRKRIVDKLNQEAFAGNRAGYKKMCIVDIGGIEDCRIFSAWDGGGTVKLAIIAPNHTIPDATFITNVQNQIDPGQTGNGIGLAPIGHKVTVVAPTEQTIAVSATLTLATGYTIEQVQSSVEAEIGKYIYQVQEDFLTKDTLIIYLAKVSAVILNVAGILNVSTVKINNSASDLTINITSSNIKYPVLGTVTLS